MRNRQTAIGACGISSRNRAATISLTGILPISRPRSAAWANGSPRAAALDRAVERRGQFSLLEVMLPRGATSDTLARFVSGFKIRRRANGGSDRIVEPMASLRAVLVIGAQPVVA